MMKRIALVLVALLVVGGVVVGFGDAIEHLIEGGDHKEANHAETAASGHRDEHDLST